MVELFGFLKIAALVAFLYYSAVAVVGAFKK